MLLLKRIIRKIFLLLNLDVKIRDKNADVYFHNDAMIAGLKGLKNIGLDFATIVDVGAAQGAWSLSASELWPSAKYLMFEPLAERQDELKSIVSKHSSFILAPYAAGSTDGELKFLVSDDLDGSGVASDGNQGNVRTVRIRSIQDEVRVNKLTGPLLIKLDTHGYELPILEGCREILDMTQGFIIEMYGFQIADRSLLFWEMCRHMEGLGFRLYNVVDVMNRPKDNAFWQCDGFFLRNDHQLFRDNHYAS